MLAVGASGVYLSAQRVPAGCIDLEGGDQPLEGVPELSQTLSIELFIGAGPSWRGNVAV